MGAVKRVVNSHDRVHFDSHGRAERILLLRSIGNFHRNIEFCGGVGGHHDLVVVVRVDDRFGAAVEHVDAVPVDGHGNRALFEIAESFHWEHHGTVQWPLLYVLYVHVPCDLLVDALQLLVYWEDALLPFLGRVTRDDLFGDILRDVGGKCFDEILGRVAVAPHALEVVRSKLHRVLVVARQLALHHVVRSLPEDEVLRNGVDGIRERRQEQFALEDDLELSSRNRGSIRNRRSTCSTILLPFVQKITQQLVRSQTPLHLVELLEERKASGLSEPDLLRNILEDFFG